MTKLLHKIGKNMKVGVYLITPEYTFKKRDLKKLIDSQ